MIVSWLSLPDPLYFAQLKMSLVNLLQVDVKNEPPLYLLHKLTIIFLLIYSNQILNNPSAYFDNFQFEITFEVISELQEGRLNELIACSHSEF